MALQHDLRGLGRQGQLRHSLGASRGTGTGRPTRFRLHRAHCIGLLIACPGALQHGLRGPGRHVQHSPGHAHNTASNMFCSTSNRTETTSTDTATPARRLAGAGRPTICGYRCHRNHFAFSRYISPHRGPRRGITAGPSALSLGRARLRTVV